MVHIETTTQLESFRRFLINSTCLSFIPESYFRDQEVFPEKEGDLGSIYIEAADKVTLKNFRAITFINARDVLGIIYLSKSGNTNLKWRQTRGSYGKVTGEASANSLVNLLESRVITREYAEELSKMGPEGNNEITGQKDEDADLFGGVESNPEYGEISGLEGTIQTADDI
jgi:hypothetical protein